MAALGLIALAGAPVFAFFGPPGDQRGEAPRLQNVGVFFRDPAFWVVAVAFWLSAALGVGAYSILPVFLASERGLDRATVNLLLGASRLTGLPAIFLAGALADRLSPRLLIGLLVGGAGASRSPSARPRRRPLWRRSCCRC
jgi:predicted MFS family arabinose efflux permease